MWIGIWECIRKYCKGLLINDGMNVRLGPKAFIHFFTTYITGWAHNIDTVQIMLLQAHKPNESQKLTTQDNLVQVILFTCKQGFMCVESFHFPVSSPCYFAFCHNWLELNKFIDIRIQTEPMWGRVNPDRHLPTPMHTSHVLHVATYLQS